MQAVCFPGDYHNPRRIMIVALVFIILSFVIGIPFTLSYYYNS